MTPTTMVVVIVLSVFFYLDENVGELEGDVFAGEFLVNGGVGADFVLNLRLLSLVQKHLRHTRSVQLKQKENNWRKSLLHN